MVVRKRSGEKAAGRNRPSSHRRKQQIQKLTVEEIQELEAAVAVVQATLDLNRYPCPERIRGFVRTNLYFRFGKVFRSVYYPLSEGVFPSRRVQSLRLAAKPRRVGKGDREDKSISSPDVSGGISGDAGIGEFIGTRHVTLFSTNTLRQLGRGIHRELGRRGLCRGDESDSRGEIKTNIQRRTVR